MSRPTLAILGVFAAVVVGAAMITSGVFRNRHHSHDSSARANVNARPMEVGNLTVHGPLKVHGQLVVRGDATIHGPVSALRVEQASQLPNPQTANNTAPREVHGPLSVDRTLIVNGDLEVSGPVEVAAIFLVSGKISTDGPLEERGDD
ncbi:MAG: hypothetical protein ACREQB_06145 [Candidatus Binataceae bacterium]